MSFFITHIKAKPGQYDPSSFYFGFSNHLVISDIRNPFRNPGNRPYLFLLQDSSTLLRICLNA